MLLDITIKIMQIARGFIYIGNQVNNSNECGGNFKRQHFGRLKSRGLVSGAVFGLLYRQ